MSKSFAARFALLVAFSLPTLAHAGKAPWENYAARLAGAHDVGALGDDLLGDSVALDNGALSFSATDASLPGNAGPAVAIGRTYRTRDWRYRAVDGMFGDWEADVPQISGNYLAGWVDSAGGQKRCSVGGAPAADASRGVLPWDYWQGLTLAIPGVGGGELLAPRTGPGLVPATPAPMPTASGYKYLTNDHIRVSCLPSIKNAEGSTTGEGFLAITPDGTRYWFDWMAVHHEPPLRRGTNTLFTTDPLGNKIPREFTIPVGRHILLATRVEDRFGNVVSYNYSNGPNERMRLEEVLSGESDGWGGAVDGGGGDGRKISVDYTGNWVSEIRDNTGRVWSYSYAKTAENRDTLASVTVPAGDKWTIGFGQFTDAELEYPENPTWGERTCFTELSPQNAGADLTPTGTITHPSGATGTFVLGIETHGRTNVPLNCANVTSGSGGNDPTDDVPHIPASYDAFSVMSKTITGNGLPTAQWTYDYASNRRYNNPNEGGALFADPYVCTGSMDACAARPVCTTKSMCSSVATTTVTAPEGRWTRYHHGNSYRENEGLLLKVESGGGSPGTGTLRTVRNTYDTDTTGACVVQWGDSLKYGIDYSECVMPVRSSMTEQQGVRFNRSVETFDEFMMPTKVQRFSDLSTGTVLHTRTDTTQYLHDKARWVIGLVEKETNVDLGQVTSHTAYHATSRLPQIQYWPYPVGGTPVMQQQLAFTSFGALKTVSTAQVANGPLQTTTLSNWYRGVPKLVTYPDATTQAAIVNSRGEITHVTDQNGWTTIYGYDTRGLLASVTYPAGDSVAWNATTLTFAKTTTLVGEYGFPVGTWKRTVSTGNGHKVTWFDAFWRPRMTREYDGTTTATATETSRFNAWVYDAAGRTQFVAYPRSTVSSMASFTDGVETEHDALDRTIWVAQDSELGLLTTTTEYLANFVTRTTNPRQKATKTWYQFFDDPSAAVPRLIDAPTGQRTQIHRNALGMALWMQRRGTAGQTEVATRYYVYDHALRLCKQTEPETGATVVDYDNAGNVIWSAAGLSLPTANPTPTSHGSTCAAQRPSAYASGRRVDRAYDTMNRLETLTFPDNTGNQTWTYTPDGLPETILTTNNGLAEPVHNGYSYNRRRMLAGETSAQPGAYSWSVGYGYNANGHLSTLTYPSLMSVSYAPNALGQPTRAGGFATGVKYYPNGAIREFVYGNGITHQMWQNARQLPARSADSGVLDIEHGFDENGNVLATADHLDASRSRWMEYDDLDRLTAAGSVSFGGDHWHRFTYDVLDNLKSWTLGPATAGGTPTKDYATYEYATGTNRLTRILGSGGQVRQSFTYDVQGNLKTKGGPTTWNFDYGNRNRGITGQEGFRYDGHGRRVSTWLPAQGKARFYMYAQSGQLLFEASETQGKNIEHVHLGGSLLASSERLAGGGSQVRYKHTDALGSPVVTTDQAGNEVPGSRQVYEPFGKPVSGDIDGIGYTGHVMDPQSDLVYMQQRYYDPDVGRFLSVDPVTANNVTGSNFNRYNYGANNPYRFVDPDGRMIQSPWRDNLNDPFKRKDSQCQTPACRFALNDSASDGKDKDKNSERRAAIDERARGSVGSDSWNWEDAKDPFPARTNKCNLFVYDIVNSVGATMPLVDGHVPQAKDLANRSLEIPGWRVLGRREIPQPGDIASWPTPGATGYSGHTGFVVSCPSCNDGLTSVGTNNPLIVADDGMFENNRSVVTFRRWTGD